MRLYYVLIGLVAIGVMISAAFIIHAPAWVTVPGAYCGGTLFTSALARRS